MHTQKENAKSVCESQDFPEYIAIIQHTTVCGSLRFATVIERLQCSCTALIILLLCISMHTEVWYYFIIPQVGIANHI